jgi:GH24 family phage-related lysozyme (muramidase)
MKPPSPNSLQLILKYEVGGGEEYYKKFLSKFTWPKGASGPTIGIGIDCAYYTQEELVNIFYFFTEDKLKLIQEASGKKGEAGKEYTKVLRQAGIELDWNKAFEIFITRTWTKFANLTEKTFYGVDQLKDDTYGALTSLIFNRGSSLNGDSRLEMRNIRVLVPKKNYKQIAEEIRKMKRLWEGKGMDGLIERREAEAKLIENCA